MNKLSSRHTYKKISKRDYSSIIRDMKAKVKADPVVQKKFKEYDIPISEIDQVSIQITDLPVSAKTKNLKIYLNKAMFDPDSDVEDPSAYLAHELTHYLQQKTGNTEGHMVEDYLEKPTEQEAFQVQVDYKKRNEGEDEAEEYVEGLLDHHDKDGKERKRLKKKLTDED